jgi:hypothetical protein
VHEHDTDAVCQLGGHRHPGPGRVCETHLTRIRAQLAGVSRMTAELPGRLVASADTKPGDKVTTSRLGSPPPARLDVLSLLAPGGREIRRDARMLAPQIRRWSTVSSFEVTTTGRDGKPHTETRTLRNWHAEPVLGPDGKPLLVMDDDQVGTIPPAEWLDTWVRRWRIALRHTSSPLRARVDLACDADQRYRVERAKIGESMRKARGVPALLPAVAQLAAVHAAYLRYLQLAVPRVRMALLGVRDDGPLHQARVAAALSGSGPLPGLGEMHVVHDPIAAEWAVRYGYAGVAAAVEVDARYLAGWVHLAADHEDPDGDVDIAAFATELGALHTELEHVLGYTSDKQWIGRCPAFLRDTDGEETRRVCGAGIWQDPYRSVIECPRCHTSWPEADWMHLANLIRVRWPIDRRRRYTQGDRMAAEKCLDRLPRCRGCEKIMRVEWTETTARGALTRTWSPAGFSCPGGCLPGGTAVVAA